MAKGEILIVGAGPAGLTMASELIRHGVQCRIIDQSPYHAGDSRAVGIQARTLEIFEDMDILPPILKKGVKVNGINIYSSKKHLLHTEYKGLDTPHSFIIDLPQSQTELILIHQLENLGLNVHRNTQLHNMELKEGNVDVMFKCEKRGLVPDTFTYVIGCDGAHSTCRHLLNLPFPGSEYPSQWVVFDAKLDLPYDPQEMHIFLHTEGVTALFPLPNNQMRVTCELPYKEEETPPILNFDFVRNMLHQRLSNEVQISEPCDLSSFIIHHRHVTQYRKGHVFLVGDAAHIHSPAGGQGMNTGIQDAYNLAWKLALVHKGVASKSILETYEQERLPIAESVLSLTDKMTKMATTKNSVLTLVRDMSMTLAGNFEKLGHQLPKRLSQLYIKYEPNKIIVKGTHHHHPTHIHIGQRAPDHIIKQGEEEKHLFQLFKGIHHTLLIFSGKKPTVEELKTAEKLCSSLKNHLHIQSYLVYRNDENFLSSPTQLRSLLDREPSLHSHYGITKATALLVRPDGYIGYIQEPLDIKKFHQYLNQIFIEGQNHDPPC